ncbi:MAG: hypothetical protein KAI66_11090, partial [Lentisphaeria bacterium]|nr:hypothetical protein [Lentisphaeria bacterium]
MLMSLSPISDHDLFNPSISESQHASIHGITATTCGLRTRPGRDAPASFALRSGYLRTPRLGESQLEDGNCRVQASFRLTEREPIGANG